MGLLRALDRQDRRQVEAYRRAYRLTLEAMPSSTSGPVGLAGTLAPVRYHYILTIAFPGNPFPGRDADELTPAELERLEAGPVADSLCVAGVLEPPATASREAVFRHIQADAIQRLLNEGRLYAWPDGRDVPINVVYFALEPDSLPGGLVLGNAGMSPLAGGR